MILKSYLAWMTIFHDVTPWSPLMKELPFILIFFCLIERFATKHKVVVYWAANLLLSGIFFAAIMYYKYFGIIVTYHMLSQVGQVGEVKNSVFFILDPYYLLIFLDLIALLIWWIRNRKSPKLEVFNSRKVGPLKIATIFVVSVALTILNIVPNRASVNELKKTEAMGILSYETYTVLADHKDKENLNDETVTQSKIDGLKNINLPKSPQFWQAAAGKNLIIIQMESFQNFLINLKVDGQEITPVMNQLANNGFYFPNFSHQAGQGNTSDAEFVVNTSYYVPEHGPATLVYANKALPSLPKLLENQGYFTATFHTNTVQFWNRQALYSSLGFNKYYDESFFGDSDIVALASSDEVLYNKTADELKRLDQDKKPFYAQIISLSAHHPFIIPDEKVHITLPARYQNTFIGNYLTAQNYADYALGQFIDKLKKSGVWDDSIILIYGDHQGLPITSLNSTDQSLMEEIYGHPYNQADMVNVPLIISAPGITSSKVYNTAGGQVDILPTVANLMGISLKDHIHFGEDLLNQTVNLLPERYYLPTGSFINDTGLFVPGVGFSDGQLQTKDPSGEASAPAPTQQQYDNALELLHLSDCYVSQLPDK